MKRPKPAFSLSDLGRLNTNLSRRDALGILAGAAGFGAFASLGRAQSRPPRRPVNAPPPKLGQTQGIVRWSQFVGPQFGPSYGIHYAGLIGMTQNSSDPKTFNVLDTYINQSGAETVLNSEQNFGQPVGLNGNMIAVPCADGTIKTLVSANGYSAGQITPPSPVVSNLLVINNNTLVYVDASNNLNAIRVTDGNTATTVFSGNLGPGSFQAVNVQASGNTFVCVAGPPGAGHSAAYIVVPTGTGITVLQTIDANFAQGPFCVAGGYFFTVENDGTQYYFQQYSATAPYTTGWFAGLGPNLIPGSPVAYLGSIYFAGNDGSLRAIDLNTGKISSPINLDPNPLNGNPLFIDNGAAFVCTSEGKLFAADLTNQGASSVVYDLQSGSNPAYLFGVENGVCLSVGFSQSVGGYFAQGVDLASELRGYSSDSSLMAEDYVAGGPTGYMPATPAYRTVVQLVDGNKNPRANTSVRIEATGTVTILSGGQTYPLSQGGYAWLTTDVTGTLNFVSQAADISSPALYIWAAFMNQGEAIVVYPDHDALNTLANKQAGDYQNAKSFDGTSITPSGVDASQVAQTVSSALSGGTSSSVSAAYGSNPYSSYPSTTANMIYQATKGDTSRAFSAASAQSFTTNITVDPTTGNVTGVSYASGTPTLPLLVGGFFSFDDFVKDVVNGAKKIAKIAVTVAEEVAHQITAITGEVYQFTVQTLEQAAAVISGFFKTLFSDIMKAVEWLSAIFDWGAIRATQAEIKHFVTNFQLQVRAYLTADTKKITTALHTFFQTAEGDIQQTIAGFIASIGGQTLQSQQQNGNDPKAPYAQTTGGYAQTQSMHSKFQDNIGSSSSSAINATIPLTFAEVKTIAEGLWTQIPATIAPLKADFDAAVTQFASSFGTLVTDPSKFVTQSFSDILTIMSDIAVILLKVVDAILELVITLIADLLDTIVNYATGGMQIPVLSELFQLIFGTPLTFLDLAAWVVAVPATIISKTVGATDSAVAKAKPHNLLGEAGLQVVCWAASQVFGSLVDATNDAINNDPASPISIMDLVCGVITFALSAPSSFNGNDPAICYFAFSIVPSIISFINIVLKATKSEISVAYNTLSYLLDFIYGTFNLLVAVANAFNNPAEFSDPNHLTLFENIFSNAGLIQKFFYESFPQGVVVLDVVCPTTAAFIGAAAAVA